MAKKQAKLVDVVDNNNELETLKALRMKLAETIDQSSSGRDIAALSRQLTGVTKRITELEEMQPCPATEVIDSLIAECSDRRVR